MPGVFMHRLHILMTVTQSIERDVPLNALVVVGGQDLTKSFQTHPEIYYTVLPAEKYSGFFCVWPLSSVKKRGKKPLGGKRALKKAWNAFALGVSQKVLKNPKDRIFCLSLQ
jgi:hypothetical protein